jgi:hypothetical protein
MVAFGAALDAAIYFAEMLTGPGYCALAVGVVPKVDGLDHGQEAAVVVVDFVVVSGVGVGVFVDPVFFHGCCCW